MFSSKQLKQTPGLPADVSIAENNPREQLPAGWIWRKKHAGLRVDCSAGASPIYLPKSKETIKMLTIDLLGEIINARKNSWGRWFAWPNTPTPLRLLSMNTGDLEKSIKCQTSLIFSNGDWNATVVWYSVVATLLNIIYWHVGRWGTLSAQKHYSYNGQGILVKPTVKFQFVAKFS